MLVDPDGHWVWAVVNAGFANYDGYKAYKSGKDWKGVLKASAKSLIGFSKVSKAIRVVKAAKGMKNPVVKKAAQKGRQKHKEYNYGPGVKKEVRLPSGRRMDGYDKKNEIIHELKPNNRKAIKRGLKQLDRYIKEANRVYGPGHKGKLHTYD